MTERGSPHRTLVLLRHGESVWNQQNRFTGWTDVDLSDKGRQQAKQAAMLLQAQGFNFDVAFTSVLKRAIRTLWIVLDEMDTMWLPVHNSWQLNERHYGSLQGLNKAETAARFSEAQVKRWRRSYDAEPPKIALDDVRYPGHDPRYQHVRPHDLPRGESLRDTAARLWPCWQHAIAPALRSQERVLVIAHGNSLRALVKHLDEISDEGIADIEIPCGVPLIYKLSPELNRMESYYLGDRPEIETAIPAQLSQTS